MMWMVVAAAIVVLSSLGGGFYGGWSMRGDKETAARVEEVQKYQRLYEAEKLRADTATEQFSTQMQAFRNEARKLNRELRNELTNAVYTQCVLPPSGSVLIQRSVGTANKQISDSGGPPAEVPTVTRTQRQDDGGSAGVFDWFNRHVRGVRDQAQQAESVPPK
jgi:hypothetical protein